MHVKVSYDVKKPCVMLSTGTEGLVPNVSLGKFFVVLDRTDGVPFTFLGIRLIG